MKKSFLSSVDTHIDLTSLLDVIFILLIVVMCNYQMVKDPAPEPEIIPVITDNPSVTVYMDFDDNDIKTRYARLIWDETTINDIAVLPGSEETAFDEIEQSIQQFINEHSEEPVFIVLDETKILYRDQKRMSEMLTELSSNNRNLYFRTADELIDNEGEI